MTSIPLDDNYKPVLALWNDVTSQAIPVHVARTVTGSDGKTYALLDADASSTTTLFTTAQATVGTSDSGDLDVSKLHEISIDITTSAQAGTNPTIQFFWKRKGADGIYYPIWQSAVLTAAANTISTSIGPGLAYNQSLGPTGKLTWTVGGTNTPTWSFTPNIFGR